MSFTKRVAESSSLTEVQLDALALYRCVKAGEVTLSQASKMRGEPSRPSTVGAFYHSVQEGKRNMREAIMALAAGIWLGYVDMADLRRLFDQLANSPGAFDDGRAEQMLPVLEALAEKIVG